MATGLVRPVSILEIAPTADPLDASPTWVDISKYLQTGSTKRGRQHELGVFQAGTMDLTLDNRDGRFNPWNTSGPYYNGGTGLRPGKPIRLRATWAGVTYPVFRGYIESFGPKWLDPVNSEIELRCTDAFKNFQQAAMTSTAYRDAVIADGATVYYRMDDTSLVRCVDVIAARNGAYVGVGTSSPVLGADGALLTEANAAADFTGYAGNVTIPAAASVYGSAAWSLEFWIKLSATPAAGDGDRCYYQPSSASYSDYFELQVDHNGRVSLINYVGANSATCTGGTISVDGRFHHVVFTRAGDGVTHKAYLDGALVNTAVAGAVLAMAASVGYIAGYPPDAGMNGLLDEVAFYQGVALTPTQVGNHWNLGSGGWLALYQYSGQRIGQVLDRIGWPAGDRAIDTGVTIVQPASHSQIESSALAYMQALELSEVGALFMGADGKVVHLQRDKLLKPPYTTSQLTLGPANEPYRLEGADPSADDQMIYNEAVCARETGQPQTAIDAASITSYGRRTLFETGLLNYTDTEVADRAKFRVSQFKDFMTRIDKIPVNPADDPATLYPQVLTRDLCECITFVRTFLGQGTGFTQIVNIEGIEHQFSPSDWWTIYSVAPSQGYWIIDTSTVDTDSRVAF